MTHKLILVYLLGIGFIFNSCFSRKHNENEKKKTFPVRTILVKYDNKVSSLHYVGVIEEEFSSTVSFPIAGTIDRIYAREGEEIVKGMLLAELNTTNLNSIYVATKAQLEQAEDAMQRIQMMYDNESVSEIKYIDVKTQLEKAKAMEIIAKKNLEDSRLIAPISGIIGRKSVEVGENVLPNQSVYTLFKIEQNVMIKIPVPEKEIRLINLGQSASITVSALGDISFEGVVAEKGIVADPISHTYIVKIKVANENLSLLPGMICTVVISNMDPDKSIILPNSCVQKNGNGGKYVWLNDHGSAKQKHIETGYLTNKGIGISLGLNSDDEVITEGWQNLFNGAPLRIIQ